jgi:hypothetical protein
MSEPKNTGHGNTPHSAAAEGHDDVDYGKVIGVGVVSLILFALSIWWSAIILRGKTETIEAKTGHARTFDMTRTEIGIVDQVPFVSDKRLPQWRKERREHLETYGWVDRGKGVVHIPIEEAMAKVAAGTMPAGAPK